LPLPKTREKREKSGKTRGTDGFSALTALFAHEYRREKPMPDYLNIARRALEKRMEPRQPEPLQDVLKGLAIELWSDTAGCLFIVADEDDARRLGEARGTVYTAAEVQRVVHIGDPAVVLEIHEWKRIFDGRVRE
jgi:hypothetical protein